MRNATEPTSLSARPGNTRSTPLRGYRFGPLSQGFALGFPSAPLRGKCATARLRCGPRSGARTGSARFTFPSELGRRGSPGRSSGPPARPRSGTPTGKSPPGEPATAAAHAERAPWRSRGIVSRRLRIVLFVIAILAPLPYVDLLCYTNLQGNNGQKGRKRREPRNFVHSMVL